MSDIFISYSSEDLDRVLPLVNALEKTAWSIFWDRTIPAGKTWRQVIGAEIQGCSTVVVVWTENSVNSEWVQEEAEIGRRRKILVPVLLDKVEPPFGFGSIQAANLVSWHGENASPAFNRLVADIAAVLGPAPEAAKEPGRGWRSDSEERRTAQEDSLREKERERVEEEARRKAREENQRRAAPGSEQTWFQRRLAMVRRLYGPTTVSVAVAVLIAFIVILQWPILQPNKQTETQAPPTAVEPEKRVIAPPQEQKEAAKEMPQSPAVVSKQEEKIATQTPLSLGKVFRDSLKSGGEGPQMVVVPRGSFKMGDVQGGGDKNEVPVHTVTIQKPFAIGRYEVTFDEYDQFAKATNRQLPNDEGWGRGRRPVINVSWQDTVEYAKWLSAQTGKRYRLPTEAEWEYAARAGKETAYWWGKDLVKGMANCAGCGSEWDSKKTGPVGSFKPNSFGLYDTAGNVWEWVEDCYHGNYNNGAPADGSAWKEAGGGDCGRRVIRGGSWISEPGVLRTSLRGRNYAGLRYITIGFRLAQDIN